MDLQRAGCNWSHWARTHRQNINRIRRRNRAGLWSEKTLVNRHRILATVLLLFTVSLSLPFCHHSNYMIPSFLTPPPLCRLKIKKKKKKEKGRILYRTKIFITSLWIHRFHQYPETKKMLTEPVSALIMYICVSMSVLYSLFGIFYIPLFMYILFFN